jgi:ABC-2 type transport system ATP-binding protein
MDTAIEVDRLAKTYARDVHAVREISFSVPRGEVFGLLGPNGAGKSTTVGMLTTTVEPSSGTAELAGFDVVRSALQARSISSVVFQEAAVDRTLSGRRNLETHARLWRVPPADARSRDGQNTRTHRTARPARGHLQRRRAATARDRPGARLATQGALP